MSLNLLFQLLVNIHLIAVLIHNCDIFLESSLLNAQELEDTGEHADEVAVEGDAEEHVEDGEDLFAQGDGGDVPVANSGQSYQSVID